MGPRSFDRGNALGSLAQNSNQTGLQWGRGLLTAEMAPPTHRTFTWRWLQWGRGLLTAEMPGLFAAPPAFCTTLQWGRGLLTAEMLKWDGDKLYWKAALQWGRGLLTAEMFTIVKNAGEAWAASMGPRSCDRGNDTKTTLPD